MNLKCAKRELDFATKICDQKSARNILNHQAHSQMQHIKTRFMIYTWVMMDLNVFEMHDIMIEGTCFFLPPPM